MTVTVDDKIKKKRKVVELLHNPLTAWVILACGLCVTGAAWYISSSAMEKRAEERFEYRIAELQKAIYDRMIVYEQALWGGVGLFSTSDTTVSRSNFRKYVETLKINEHWPGIQGIGFSIPVSAQDKDKHIRSIRAEGFPNFTIKPEGERKEYSSIIYLEPFDWRNKRAFGYDMWSNEMRREAMTRARDLGVASTSGIITLVQETEEDVQKGFLTYLPVYKQGMPIETVAQRQVAFLGWVYSPFRMGDLMKGILGSAGGDIDYEIFDGALLDPNSMLYDSNNVFHKEDQSYQPDFTSISQLELQGRKWKLYFQSKPGYISSAESLQPTIILVVGIIIDLLLFYVITALVFLQKRARLMAEEMTGELRSAKSKVEDQLELVEDKNKELECFTEMTVGREERMIDLKKEVNRLCRELGRNAPYNNLDNELPSKANRNV